MNVQATQPSDPRLSPPITAPPRRGEAWVWAIPFDDPPVPETELAAILSAEERARVGRFRFEEDRLRAVVGRGLLRTILASCIATPPDALEFFDGGNGKPALATAGGETLAFNVSHSGDWVLIGLAAGGRIGVDVERIRPLDDLDALVERFFAPGEARAVRELSAELRVDAFFHCWTRKEAYIKAVGAGLMMSLGRFEVESRPGFAPALLSVDGSTAEAERWRMWSQPPDAEHRAAVATEGRGPVRAWYWSGRDGLTKWAP